MACNVLNELCKGITTKALVRHGAHHALLQLSKVDCGPGSGWRTEELVEGIRRAATTKGGQDKYL